MERSLPFLYNSERNSVHCSISIIEKKNFTMNIQSNNTYHKSHAVRLDASKKQSSTRLKKTNSSKSKPSQDAYETTAQHSRTEYLETIKRKIKAGYYSSQEVVEELSDDFAKAFEQGINSLE